MTKTIKRLLNGVNTYCMAGASRVKRGSTLTKEECGIGNRENFGAGVFRARMRCWLKFQHGM